MWRKAHQNASNDKLFLCNADLEPRMERRVYFQSESGRAQAGVAGVRRESLDTGRFPWNGRNSIGEFAKRAGKSCHSTEKLSVASTKVSWVCFYVVFILVVIYAFCFRHVNCLKFTSINVEYQFFQSLKLVLDHVSGVHLKFIMHLFEIWTPRIHRRRQILNKIGKS